MTIQLLLQGLVYNITNISYLNIFSMDHEGKIQEQKTLRLTAGTICTKEVIKKKRVIKKISKEESEESRISKLEIASSISADSYIHEQKGSEYHTADKRPEISAYSEVQSADKSAEKMVFTTLPSGSLHKITKSYIPKKDTPPTGSIIEQIGIQTTKERYQKVSKLLQTIEKKHKIHTIKKLDEYLVGIKKYHKKMVRRARRQKELAKLEEERKQNKRINKAIARHVTDKEIILDQLDIIFRKTNKQLFDKCSSRFTIINLISRFTGTERNDYISETSQCVTRRLMVSLGSNIKIFNEYIGIIIDPNTKYIKSDIQDMIKEIMLIILNNETGIFDSEKHNKYEFISELFIKTQKSILKDITKIQPIILLFLKIILYISEELYKKDTTQPAIIMDKVLIYIKSIDITVPLGKKNSITI